MLFDIMKKIVVRIFAGDGLRAIKTCSTGSLDNGLFYLLAPPESKGINSVST